MPGKRGKVKTTPENIVSADSGTIVPEGENIMEETTTSNSSDTTSENGLDLSKLQADFTFRGPITLRMAVEEAAAEAKLPLTSYLRKVVADYHNFTLPTEAARATSLTEDEKKAKIEAQKAKDKAQRALVKRVLAENRKAEEATV